MLKKLPTRGMNLGPGSWLHSLNRRQFLMVHTAWTTARAKKPHKRAAMRAIAGLVLRTAGGAGLDCGTLTSLTPTDTCCSSAVGLTD